MDRLRLFSLLTALLCAALAIGYSQTTRAAGGEKPVKRDYAAAGVIAPPAPAQQTVEEMLAKSAGCTSCHTARDAAHVLPTFPESWHYPSSATPKRSYTLLNKEAPEFVRFVNPSDYRVVREACGACHMDTIVAGERSIMATGAMLWGGAAYNNGIAPFKNYIFGESFTRDGEPAKLVSPGETPGVLTEAQKARGALAEMYPLPA